MNFLMRLSGASDRLSVMLKVAGGRLENRSNLLQGLGLMGMSYEPTLLFCGAMVVVILAGLCTPRALAQAPQPADPCPKLAGKPAGWREQEHWAWSAICGGFDADLHRPDEEGP